MQDYNSRFSILYINLLTSKIHNRILNISEKVTCLLRVLLQMFFRDILISATSKAVKRPYFARQLKNDNENI